MKISDNLNCYKNININYKLGVSVCVLTFYDNDDNKLDNKTEYFHDEETADLFIKRMKQEIRIKKLKRII